MDQARHRWTPRPTGVEARFDTVQSAAHSARQQTCRIGMIRADPSHEVYHRTVTGTMRHVKAAAGAFTSAGSAVTAIAL
jgi:hypothetical protein